MKNFTIGIIREGKVPPDHRVALTPTHCVQLTNEYPNLKIIVQPSPIRAYKDQEYLDKGFELNEDLSACDLIIGVKEVNVSDLIPNKKFMFFSHTLKKQPYNRGLLNAILEKNIALIDYEAIRNKQNKRIIGFGRYAGIVGAYNAFRTFGIKSGLYNLVAAHQCKDRKSMEQAMVETVVLPKNYKVVLTGFGRVGQGAREIVNLLPIKEVTPSEFLNQSFDEPVFTHLDAEDYYGRIDGKQFDKGDFYANPSEYQSTFNRFVGLTDMYIPCHFWSNKSPFILTNDDLLNENSRIKVVADISCDIAGPIACTIRPSKVADPIYGYNPITKAEDDFKKEGIIAVMAIDNLPCELPLDASEDFGNELIRFVFPYLVGEDPDRIIARATETTSEGTLTSDFSYLQAYVEGKE
jgi:alanine dehydrogenase